MKTKNLQGKNLVDFVTYSFGDKNKSDLHILCKSIKGVSQINSMWHIIEFIKVCYIFNKLTIPIIIN